VALWLCPASRLVGSAFCILPSAFCLHLPECYIENSGIPGKIACARAKTRPEANLRISVWRCSSVVQTMLIRLLPKCVDIALSCRGEKLQLGTNRISKVQTFLTAGFRFAPVRRTRLAKYLKNSVDNPPAFTAKSGR
jgi:hypothetical protein